MKLLTVIGLFLNLIGVMILGVGEMLQGAASLRFLKERYQESFDHDVQQRPWYARPLLKLGATLATRTLETQRQPLPYRIFPLTVYGFCFLIVGLLLQWLAALYCSDRHAMVRRLARPYP